MRALTQNQTWNLQEFLKDRKVVGYKWVLKNKYRVDSFVERVYVMIKLSLVSKKSSVRLVLALTNVYDWEIKKMDMKISFFMGSSRRKS